MSKQELLNLSYEELIQYFESIGEKAFRAKQIFEWIYRQGVTSFDEMRNLSQGLRAKLNEQFTLNVLAIHESPVQETSADGTTKFLFTLADGEKI